MCVRAYVLLCYCVNIYICACDFVCVPVCTSAFICCTQCGTSAYLVDSPVALTEQARVKRN